MPLNTTSATLQHVELLTLAHARELGIELWQLRSRKWQRVAHGIYARAEEASNPMTILAAARLRLPPAAVFSGFTAGWLHGLGTPPTPVEMTIPNGIGISGRAGMKLRRRAIETGDVVIVRKQPATGVELTLSDLSRRVSLTEAVVLIDVALHLRRTKLDKLGGRAEVMALRRALAYAEPKTESPMETRLRMVIALAALPRPIAQVPIYDRHGNFIGRPDLYYPDHRLGIEYDGGQHKNQLAEDNRRQNLLLEAGVRLLRFTAADVLSRPEVVVAQVKAMLK